MVISQIAGLATAFGTGELSGAGFGPNYTILMKLGYEFFAPRILEEMEKNPNVFFQDTLWFKKFQKQIKLYSDTVMKETLDTLLTIPQDTIDKIADKFRDEGSRAIPSFPGAPNIPVTVSPALNQLITLTKVLDTLIHAFQNMNFNFNIVPQAFGATPPPPSSVPDNLQNFRDLQPVPEGPPRETTEQRQKREFEEGGRLKSQKEWELKWDKQLRDDLTIIANQVNQVTSGKRGSRRMSRSVQLQLRNLSIGRNQALQAMKALIQNIKISYTNKKLRLQQLYSKKVIQHRGISLRIAQTLMLYAL